MYRKLLIWLILSSIFLDDYLVGGNSSEVRASMPFDLYYYYIFFLLVILYYIKTFRSFLPYPKYFLMACTLFFSASILGAFSSNLIGFSMLKQMLGILFSGAAYYATIELAEFNIKKLFVQYTKLAIIVAAIGVIQEMLYLGDFHNLFGNVKRMSIGFYRVYSIMGEPYFLAVAITPALFYFFNKVFGIKTFREINAYNLIALSTLLLCFIFTFSTGGMIGLALIILITAYNRLGKKIYILLPLLALYVAGNANSFKININEFQVRIEDTFKGFVSGGDLDREELAEMNSSSFALVSNFIIAQESIKRNPYFGCGIGNHEHLSNEMFVGLFGKDFLIRFGNFNAKDANSLFIRMMSEGGFLGLLLLLYIYLKPFKFRKGIKDPNLVLYTLINQACFIMFSIRIVRTGNYISQGFMFFIFLYVISSKEIIRVLKEKRALDKAESDQVIPSLD